jgi:cysteinyl-tRNA synthetase
MLRLFNTLTRKKEEFKPVVKGKVGLYTCGPTVYDFVHIGNLRAFVFEDILKRYLKYKGFKVKHVMNITDVDDKTIKNSHKQGKSLKEFTEYYTKEFLKDLETLNIEMPDIMPKATEHIKEMAEMVEKLKKNGYAYEAGDSIYYRISKFKDYGKLALLDAAQLKKDAEGRLNDADEYDKEDVRDFALWKAWDKQDKDVFWQTSLGKGRPGWHIECSAMSMKYLGETFDIHCGGVDLVFPHHTNEIAQAEGATGKKFVKYWVHNAHLIVNGEKMSKSLGNYYTLRDLLKKGYEPNAIRYELLATHYRQRLNFKEDSLKKIPDTLQRFYDFLGKLDEVTGKENNPKVEKLISKAKKDFEAGMDDDLNISAALSAIFDLMREINKLISDNKLSKKNALDVKKTMLGFDSVLGVMQKKKEAVPAEVKELAQKREKARKDKNWGEADKLRDKLKNKGYVVEDTSKGPRIKKI